MIISSGLSKKRGLTLMELLVVLAIIGMLSGIGLVFISQASKQFGFQATRGAIVSLLRYARSRAITDKAPTEVVFDINNREVYCLVRQNIRLWHMEDATGAFGFDATLSGGVEFTTDGRYGRALLFNGKGEVDCGGLSLKGNETALSISVWIYPVKAINQMIIRMSVSAGDDDYWLMLTEDRGLRCKFGDIQAISSSHMVPLGRWSQIRMSYEVDLPNLYHPQEGRLKVWLNNSLVAEVEGITKAHSFNSLTISAGDLPFYGKIDEVKISVVIKAEQIQLEPPNISITSNLTPGDDNIKISFDARGNLAGGSSSEIALLSPSTGETFRLNVNAFGMVEVE